tara:strand:- start:48 stop:1199 length:1152 start_codon:yes stop_codon:yes gene_type:complete
MSSLARLTPPPAPQELKGILRKVYDDINSILQRISGGTKRSLESDGKSGDLRVYYDDKNKCNVIEGKSKKERGIIPMQSKSFYDNPTGNRSMQKINSKWHFGLHSNGLNLAETGVSDNRFLLKAGGGVGINTVSPSALLHVGQDDGTGVASSGETVRLALAPPHHTGNDWRFWTRDNTPAASYAYLGIGYTDEILTIRHDGKVGIGTEDPDTILHLQTSGNNNCVLKIEADSATDFGEDEHPSLLLAQDQDAVQFEITFDDIGGHGNHNQAVLHNKWDNDTADIHFKTRTDSTRMTILGSGEVGIGETAPDNTLHVKNASGITKEVIKLEQLDDDEPFVLFTGTAEDDQTKSLTTVTTVGAITGHIRVSINGTDHWVPYYATS